MAKRIRRHLHMLKTLCQCKPKDQRTLLKAANNDLINAVCDCVTNIVYGRIPITKTQKRRLSRRKKVWRDLADPTKTTKKKRQLLVQHGAGLLELLLKPPLSVLF